jgi:hypothetical protein
LTVPPPLSPRYRLLPFDEAADSASLFSAVLGDVDAEVAGAYNLQQWRAVVEHLMRLGAKRLLVQSHVRDQDFLHEYEAYYARQHRYMRRDCIRVHAFSSNAPIPSSLTDQSVLDFLDEVSRDDYLGFATIRPLRHAPIGVTILADGEEREVTAKDRFPVHIGGVSFEVIGTPFLQQDSSVGACAQASIWMALRTLRRRVGNAAYSPTELTLAAKGSDRVVLGRKGLTVGQMLDAIRLSGHDPFVIDWAQDVVAPHPAHAQRVLAEARPYLDSGLPVIAVLKPEESEVHCVVALGITLAADGFVVHNDNEGPYQLLGSANEGPHNYSLEQIVSLIVALPHGIAVSAAEAMTQAQTALEKEIWARAFWASQKSAPVGELQRVKLRAYLCSRHAFRKWARECKELDPIVQLAYRTRGLPKYVWVAELHIDGNSANTRIGEIVIDAGADVMHGDEKLFIRFTKFLFVEGASLEQGSVLVQFGSALKNDDSSLTVAPRGDLTEGLWMPWVTDM